MHNNVLTFWIYVQTYQLSTPNRLRFQGKSNPFFEANHKKVCLQITMKTPRRLACIWCNCVSFWNHKALRQHLNNTICGRREKYHRNAQNTASPEVYTPMTMDDEEDGHVMPMDDDNIP
jgi:hypothetical protein